MILAVDSDEVVGGCLVGVLKKNGFSGYLSKNAIEAINFVDENGAPEMVFLDVMLTGPDGFTFLNEMASYADTMGVPVVVVSERDFAKYDLSEYGVVGYLNKNTMKPEEILDYARKYT
ncbi:response regulator [Candidatus Saccharibacteria bacterium]|nr:response regulator [Candidatus Saccharibacteria bacterium]